MEIRQEVMSNSFYYSAESTKLGLWKEMVMKHLVKKLRKYEIMIRKVANNHLQGDYQSIFKGAGLEFDDLRPYQYGDDIRTIEWKVSAKGHGTFVKTYKEDKDQ